MAAAYEESLTRVVLAAFGGRGYVGYAARAIMGLCWLCSEGYNGYDHDQGHDHDRIMTNQGLSDSLQSIFVLVGRLWKFHMEHGDLLD